VIDDDDEGGGERCDLPEGGILLNNNKAVHKL
jgi:hypothetical protein